VVVVVVAGVEEELQADRSAAAASPIATIGTALRPRLVLSGLRFVMSLSPFIIVGTDADRSTGRATATNRT
jgi:hypothetical protein